MANAEHLKILKSGVEKWNSWREKKKNIGLNPDLTYANLSDTDLTYANLSCANMTGANLMGANLTEADLICANLTCANLTEANLLKTNLSGADLSGAILVNAELIGSDLCAAILNGADLEGADLTGANMSGTDPTRIYPRARLIVDDLFEVSLIAANLIRTNLKDADLSNTTFRNAILSNANLSGADLSGASLPDTDLSGADLSGADLSGADLSGADLSGANMTGANLDKVVLVETNLTRANLEHSTIYGISAWGIKKDGTLQKNLVITKKDEPEITVDNLEIAQFIYLMINNQNIRDVIDALTSKTVLILGRFSDNRKPLLDAIKDELRKRNYLPILFDFEKPASRDLTETISILAKMSRFVIADLTDAKSISQELSHIVPHTPSLPVLPIILQGQLEYVMFEHFKRYPWVLPLHAYQTPEAMLSEIVEVVIEPAERKVKELRGEQLPTF